MLDAETSVASQRLAAAMISTNVSEEDINVYGTSSRPSTMKRTVAKKDKKTSVFLGRLIRPGDGCEATELAEAS